MALKESLETFEKALNRLKEAYQEAEKHREMHYYPFFRDSALQRFEFSVETMWKAVKVFLFSAEGLSCRSPKGCIRELFSSGHITETEATHLLEMIDDRNLTSHTYREEVAEEIFSRLGNHIEAMENVLRKLKAGKI